MASVYQCVRCKALFKDLSSVRTHVCRSVTHLKDSQNPRQNPGHSISMTNAKGQATDDQPNQLRTSQQVNLNINAVRNVGTSNQDKGQTGDDCQSAETSSPCKFSKQSVLLWMQRKQYK